MKSFSNLPIRVPIFLSLAIVTPLGFFFKFYSGPGRAWFNDYGGGVLYEVFWILVLFFIWPKRSEVFKIPVTVFGVTCMLEFLQLWHPPFLGVIRSTFLGQTLIGTTFVWWDLAHYLLGSVIGWFWLQVLSKERTDEKVSV